MPAVRAEHVADMKPRDLLGAVMLFQAKYGSGEE